MSALTLTLSISTIPGLVSSYKPEARVGIESNQGGRWMEGRTGFFRCCWQCSCCCWWCCSLCRCWSCSCYSLSCSYNFSIFTNGRLQKQHPSTVIIMPSPSIVQLHDGTVLVPGLEQKPAVWRTFAWMPVGVGYPGTILPFPRAFRSPIICS